MGSISGNIHSVQKQVGYPQPKMMAAVNHFMHHILLHCCPDLHRGPCWIHFQVQCCHAWNMSACHGCSWHCEIWFIQRISSGHNTTARCKYIHTFAIIGIAQSTIPTVGGCNANDTPAHQSWWGTTSLFVFITCRNHHDYALCHQHSYFLVDQQIFFLSQQNVHYHGNGWTGPCLCNDIFYPCQDHCVGSISGCCNHFDHDQVHLLGYPIQGSADCPSHVSTMTTVVGAFFCSRVTIKATGNPSTKIRCVLLMPESNI